MRRLLSFLLLALAACGQQPMPTNHQTTDGPTRTAVPAGEQLWKPPATASKADKAAIGRWSIADEGCRGGPVTLDDPICKKRDALEGRLRKHGWCWGAPMSKSAADNDWHRCGAYDTDNLTEADIAADVQRTSLALGEGNNAQTSADVNPHADDWYIEKHRPKSPLLQAYENAVEPIDQKIALANILTECGIRGAAWH